ncbi:hypothetical protein NKH89_31125 [Mesorhizobium sp. M0923]|uniref:hypothetical protein n=1 Tax=unclassified Mesorhizobium TaxID=325217 RepID=UPI00333922D8
MAQKVQDVSGAVAQKVSAAIDSWQERLVQAMAEPSRAIVSGPDASAVALVERSVVPALPTSAERPKKPQQGA